MIEYRDECVGCPPRIWVACLTLVPIAMYHTSFATSAERKKNMMNSEM